MASPSYTYTLTNGTTADASQVMQNFNDILNGVTDGTKDLSISALTCAGTATFNGNVNLGNASGDDVTWTGSLASTIPIKTTNSYDIGSTTLGLRALYFGANSQTVNIKGSASMSATWTLTLPVTAGSSGYALTTNGSGVTSWTDMFADGAWATYSPTFKFGSTTATMTAVVARYRTVGKVVVVNLTATLSSSNGGTGNLSVTMPVTRGSSNPDFGVGSLVHYHNGDTKRYPGFMQWADTSTLTLFHIRSGNGTVANGINITDGNTSSSAQYALSLVYEAA